MIVLTVPARGGNAGDTALKAANPMIGTDHDGHVYPGAAVPFGFVQISPDTVVDANEWCSGYDYSSTYLLGFSLNHLTGTGCPDLGNFLFLPVAGKLDLTAENAPNESYRARFSHAGEEASPGYYRVFLPDSKVNVELTATTRVGLQRYTFAETTEAHVLLDLWHGVGNRSIDSALTIENDHTISGYRKEIADGCLSPGGLKEYYFVAEFSRPFASSGIFVDGHAIAGKEAHGANLKAHFDYAPKAGQRLEIRAGLSTVSVAGARRNLRKEVNHANFDAVAAAAKKDWRRALDKIQIETPSADLKRIFYTALYHTQLTPIVFSDVDGQFRGPDNQVHQARGFTYYTDFSVWDTFRAEQPLLTLLQPGRVNDMIRTMLLHYNLLGQQMLPLCAYAGRETFCMIGNPSIPVIAEAYAKGLRDWDPDEALTAMVGASDREDEQHSSFEGMAFYHRQGWIPSKPYVGDNIVRQSVSKTLEFCYDDACLARFALRLGQTNLADIYARRSTNWRNVFDPSTGFMRGRNPDGGWVTPFDPKRIDFADYTEANAWEYTFFVPHDVPGLIEAMGGDQKFIAKLDELFDTKEQLVNNTIGLTGLLGMYCHGNEPSHNFAYLYNYAGQPWKTQARVRQIARAFYTSTPSGLCGNDDCGQMSAWYVFAALGFYPVDPPTGVYVIGSPLVNKATIQLDRKYHPGREFTMIAKNNSEQNIYIQSATLNGRELTRSWITHDEIIGGGTLVLTMGPTPNRTWGVAPTDRPAQALKGQPYP